MNTKRDELIDKFERLKAADKVPILYMAMEYMRGYNGRTMNDCIALAMRDKYSPELSNSDIAWED